RLACSQSRKRRMSRSRRTRRTNPSRPKPKRSPRTPEGAMPRVTALRSAGLARVRVELDGTPWRTIPVEVAARVGVWLDVELDRPRLRALARELRRVRALSEATGALARRDYSAGALEERLERRRIAPAERRQALETLQRAGYMD